MTDLLSKPCTVFDGTRRLVSGPLADVAPHFKKALEKGGVSVFLFDDATGRASDIVRVSYSERELTEMVRTPAASSTSGA